MIHNACNRQVNGFALIEALVALLIISMGLLGVAKLQSLSMGGATDTKAKAQATALLESEIDTLRNRILKTSNELDTAGIELTGTSYDAALANATVSRTVTPANASQSFTVETTVSTPSGTNTGKLIKVKVSWTDLLNNKLQSTSGSIQSVNGQTLVSWDDPGLGRSVLTGTPGGGTAVNYSLKTPTGVAQRGDGAVDSVCSGCSATNDGFGTKKRTLSDGTVELRSSTGQLLLTLPHSSVATENQFTTIKGRVFLDVDVNGFNVVAGDLSVRLSSEGVCLYDSNSTVNVPASGSTIYKYFNYICYVGEGWYGNVGIWNAGTQTPKICVGDPTFNSGNSDGTLISPNARESATRSFRGFKSNGAQSYFSTGVRGNSSYDPSGLPLPSAYTSYGSVTGVDFFKHDFLVTKSNQNCVARMGAVAGTFLRNAGQYYCISPDDDAATDVCPSIWPGFESQVSSGGGTTNYNLSVNITGSGSVSSNPAGVNCTSTCTGSFAANSSVTLTATAANGYSFSGWSGACSGTGTCTVAMGSDQAVTATFAQSAPSTYQLRVSLAGSGTGSISASGTPSGFPCTTGTCTANISASSTVTLTATPQNSSTFAGWSGACSGSSLTCTVTMDGAKSVTATFAASSPVSYNLAVTKSNSGTGLITSSPAGINCGTTCSYGFAAGSSVTLSASPTSGSIFGGWSGDCSGTGSCNLTMSGAKSVSATFYPSSCTTTLTGAIVPLPSNANAVQFILNPSLNGNPCTNTNNTSNYSCSLSYAGGTSFSLKAKWKTTGNTEYTSGTLNLIANCTGTSNVNIP